MLRAPYETRIMPRSSTSPRTFGLLFPPPCTVLNARFPVVYAPLLTMVAAKLFDVQPPLLVRKYVGLSGRTFSGT
jgi:hypothetical protein